ncbi:MAG: MFS transporter [Acidobacteria bacterium]|nr:MFS transporter [Acidobacteriota bacterium]
MVSQLFDPKERGFPTGLFECGTSFGLSVGTVLTAFLSSRFGWRVMFMVIGFGAMFWLIPWTLLVPSRRTTNASPGPGEVGRLEVFAPRKKRFITLNRNLMGICSGMFFFNYRWYLLVTWLPTYLVSVRHMSVMTAGILSAVPYWLYASMQPVGGRIGDMLIRRGYDESKVRKSLIGFGFLCGLLILPVPIVESPSLAIGLLIASSLVGISVANMLVVGQTCAPRDEIGIWAGASNFTGNIAGVLAPVVTGFLVEQTGSYLVPFALGAGAMLPALLSYVFIVGKVETPAERLVGA